MDQLVLAAGTALVGAIATDTWQEVRQAVVTLWHHLRSQQKTDDIGTDLEELRENVLVARRNGDSGMEKALEGAWQVKLQQLLRADPTLAKELKRVMDQVLMPALTPAEQTRIGKIVMTGASHDSSTFIQIGTQSNYNQP